MKLSVILAAKAYATISVTPEATLLEVSRTLSAHRIGAVLVLSETSSLLGIISERDIVRAIAAKGTEALAAVVVEHMTTRVVTATGDTSILDALASMTGGRFRHMPVMRGSEVQGIVSIGDLVKHRIENMQQENEALHAYITAA